MNNTIAAHHTNATLVDMLALFKPRVMALVVFTAAVGMVVAPTFPHPIEALAAIVFIAIGAGAAGALNMYCDADIDSVMARTRHRPIPMGKITRSEVLWLGIWLSVFAVVMLALAANFIAAGLLALTIVFYVCIYTLWLKRTTPYNIVIGGAAGACPPMIGWAVATAGISWESLLMFLLIFAWTPPHSWALALFSKADYSKVHIPMLPIARGTQATKQQIVLYTLLTVVCAMALGFSSIGGAVYLSGASVMNVLFVFYAIRLWQRSDMVAENDGYAYEKKFFGFSIVYIFVVFMLLVIEKVV